MSPVPYLGGCVWDRDTGLLWTDALVRCSTCVAQVRSTYSRCATRRAIRAACGKDKLVLTREGPLFSIKRRMRAGRERGGQGEQLMIRKFAQHVNVLGKASILRARRENVHTMLTVKAARKAAYETRATRHTAAQHRTTFWATDQSRRHCGR